MGVTKHMLDAIQRPRVWLHNNEAYKIGDCSGMPADILATCFQHMAAWASLAASVARTEFPDFEIAKSFRIFRLSDSDHGPDHSVVGGAKRADGIDFDADFARLAATFGVNTNCLKSEFEAVQGIAEHIFQSEQVSSRDAWCQAVRKISTRSDSRERTPTQTLRKILERYLVWTVSTSGVEQNFSLAKWICYSRRAGMTEQRELDEIQIASSPLGKADSLVLIQEAQTLWRRVAGLPRNQLATRLRGYRQPKRKLGMAISFKEFLKKRRTALNSLPGVVQKTPTALHAEGDVI